MLVNPDWTGIRRQMQPQVRRIWQPLDLAIAAALLEQDGFSVELLDNNVHHLPPKALGARAARFDKVFVTSSPYDRWQCPALDLSFFFRSLAAIPRGRLYIMGAHVTERPETLLRESRARAAILGEPERTVLELARMDVSTGIPSDIPGIAFMKKGRLVRSPERRDLEDLNELPYPAYHLLDMKHYGYDFLGRDFAILEASRGCPHHCSFCYLGMYGNRFRQKGLDRLLGEVAYVKERFGVRNIYFMDLEFALEPSFVKSFCRAMIKEDMGVNWCCQTRVSDVDDDLLSWMSRAGCSLIHFGVEAGSPRVLEQTRKGIRISDGDRAVSKARTHGIRTALFMNFGFPGETRKEMEATIDLAIRLNPTYASFHLIVPFPGTRMAREIGLDPESFPPHQYPHYNHVGHELSTLKAMLRKAYARFYLRPGYLKHFLRAGRLPGLGQGRLFLRLLRG